MADLLERFRQGVLALSARAERHETARTLRRAVVLAGRLARKPLEAGTHLAGLQRTMDQHADEVATWVPPEALLAGEGGPFDACDLRHWLALAERAGVAYVPAREILLLTEEEMSLASGVLDLGDGPVIRRVRRGLAEISELKGVPIPPEEPEADRAGRGAELTERLHAAMDAVPEGWMVRSARCGPSGLKALAGMGALGADIPEVRFGPDLEVGPGWVRTGNRRRVHASDNRTVESYAQGPGGDLAFLARPWKRAARWFVGEDPHRHGTQFAGKGAWPVEWRAFVEKGVVVGVASYYGWCGSATPLDARQAIEVRALAQRIVDEAVAQRAYPRLWDVEFIRGSGNPALLERPEVAAALDLFGREDVACTLDFIEADGEGLMLLEGGPANTPFGGGHPCAFAGCGGRPTFGRKTETHGVAFRMMPHVNMADPSTWEDGDHTGHILPWDEVSDLIAD